MPDFSRVPVIALSSETKQLISTLLNPPKVIPSSTGLLRDWRGFAQVCLIGGETLPAIASDPDPFNRILSIVYKNSQNFTFESLTDALEKIERWDIVDDSVPLLEKDAEQYLERLQKSETTAQKNDFETDAEILTLDDQFRIERGQETQQYDAFLLYADEDTDFANEILESLEKKNSLKICIKDRDLIAGITFEHEAIMRLISERCNRLITIISPDFLRSPANKFFLNFAQATGIDKRQERKIIPIIYKNCELPPQLTYFSKIYYKKLAPEYFWDKLIRSMKAMPSVANTQQITKVPKEIKSINIEQSNGFVSNQSAKEEKVKENPSAETSKSSEPVKSRSLFPWIRKKKIESNKVPNAGEESTTTESIPSLPSLDGLDSLSSLTSNTNSTKKKKKKFMDNYVKKVQSLLAKS